MTADLETTDRFADPAPTARLSPRRRRHSTQNLILAWCLWLIASWLVSLGDVTATLAARLTMPFAALFGLMVMWPVLRLSQWRDQDDATMPPFGWGQVLAEWFVLNLVLQAVIWPLMINGSWTLNQTLWLDAAMAGWSLLVGLIVACGVNAAGGWLRGLTMSLCLLLVLGEPALMALLNTDFTHGLSLGPVEPGRGVVWQWKFSPIQAVADMTRPYDAGSAHRYGPQVIAVGVAAVLGWLGLSRISNRWPGNRLRRPELRTPTGPGQ